MFFQRRWRNYKLQAARRKLQREGARVTKEARKKKDESIFEDWYAAKGWEIDLIDAQIKENESRDLINEAERLYLPTPDYSDKEKWVDQADLGVYGQMTWVLTPEAMTELRTAIRKEWRERREVVESWLKIIGAFVAPLVGLVGAVIGLVAIVKKK